MKKRITGIVIAMTLAATTIQLPTYAETDNDPTYYAYLARDGTGTEYTATVTLENIKATYGTFGLKYDTDLFEFKGITQDEGSPPVMYTPASMYGGTDSGYYVFVWQAGAKDASEFDAIGGKKPIATLKFTLKQGADADDIAYNSFTVIPWNDTGPAKEFAATLPADDPDFEPKEYYSEYWRYTDGKNEASPLERGRLEKSKASILGLSARGFYQASVNAEAGSEITDTSYFYDVKTVIEYGFDVKNSILRFHVIDKDTGEDIEGAAVTLYDSGGEKTTDGQGNADYITDAHASETFTYTVTKQGYCPVPASGSDRPSVTTAEGTSTEVTVELEKGYKLKGYVDLGQGGNISDAVKSGANVTFTRGDGAKIVVQTTADRSDAEFKVDALPKGTWTVTVTKQGYVKYEITDFEFTPAADAGETIFGLKDDGGVKKITPYIGSTHTGTSVSLIDAAAIKAEMREGAAQTCGDVDNDGRVDATDMAYVMFNYGKRTVRETYGAFITSPQPEKP